MICGSGSLDDLAAQIAEDLAATPIESSLLEATEILAESCITTQSFSTSAFLGLMAASDLSFEQLYRMYVGKNVLNFFRQDHGYKDGSYIKIWDDREDNEHLSDLLVRLDSNQTDFADAVYQGLAAAYPG